MSFLALENISKSFYGVPVLRNVSLELQKAEIHGLIGENGAGKSTLMNICSGILTCDEGQIIFEGEKRSFSHPAEAEKAGIIHIHQELNILPDLTVVENLFLGREIHRRGVLQEARMKKKAQHVLDNLGVELDITAKAGSLALGHQQMIEIARALLHNDTKLIILDEPTSSLTQHEIEKLFEIITFLRAQNGVSFIYVSHRMKELFQICARVTILRDGSNVGTRNLVDSSIDEIVPVMIGRKIQEQYGTRQTLDSSIYKKTPVLQVKNISSEKLKNIYFNLFRGEILGFYGLVGAGRTDLLNAIFGADSVDSGEIILDSIRYRNATPALSIKKGMGLLTENRKEKGIFANLSVQSNISISNPEPISRWNVISHARETRMVQKLVKKLAVKTTDVKHSIVSLSGGNQQKVLLCRNFTYPLKVLLLDEPTRGIDVGSKHDIYLIIRKLAQNNVGLIMVSSELPEILSVADRIAVMHEGKLIKILNRDEANEETVMYLATNAYAQKNSRKQYEE